MYDVRLLRGEILVLMRSSPLCRGLRVDTGYGTLRVENAHFDASRSHGGAQVGVYDGSVVLWRELESLRVDTGERLIYRERGEVERQRTDPDDLAWADGLVVAKDWRLDDFAEYLGRQRRGLIRVDPAVAGLRLSGVFPLDDAERALRALEPVLPVVVTRHTQFWLHVGPRGA
ncbi:putative signal transduction protein [Achromobacter xylosoxidans NBRC 15126 = ATCC 27061]|nr:putative signal transduction protein [Achromobacter xylosoxidans NBRC 15126 = ATCC 27061]